MKLAEILSDNYHLVNDPYTSLSQAIAAIVYALQEQGEVKEDDISSAREDIAEMLAFLPDLDADLSALQALCQFKARLSDTHR